MVMPGGGATPGGGVWFEVREVELVEGEGVRYSRSSSSRVTALEPGGRDGEPLACEAWKNSLKGFAPQSILTTCTYTCIHMNLFYSHEYYPM